MAGYKAASEILLLGSVVSAVEAVRWGMVNWIVADDVLVQEAMRIATRLASLDAEAVQANKRLILNHMTPPFAEADTT